MTKKWKILARHKWVAGATITESMLIDPDLGFRRFTGAIRGWNNWHIWQGETYHQEMKPRVDEIVRRIKEIRERIDSKDESVFAEKGAW